MGMTHIGSAVPTVVRDWAMQTVDDGQGIAEHRYPKSPQAQKEFLCGYYREKLLLLATGRVAIEDGR